MNGNPTKKTVLLVDDVPENIAVLGGVLGNTYHIKIATSGIKALQIANGSAPPHLILLDIMMPGLDGFETCRQLKSNPLTQKIPVIFVTARGETRDETLGFQLGAADYITKPVNPSIVKARVKTHLLVYQQNCLLEEHNRTLEETVRERTAALQASRKEVIRTRLEIVRRLGRAGEYRDNQTGLHVIRMSLFSQFLARALGWDEEESELLLNAAPMHDVGKIGIPDSILLKPGPLTKGEWKIMQFHPEFGSEIIGVHDSALLSMARMIALTHHEKWDGSGYPKGLRGEEIPLSGRIVAIADVFDALASDRPYKASWSLEDTLAWMKKERGGHFDPQLLDRFLDIMPEIVQIKEKYGEEGGPMLPP